MSRYLPERVQRAEAALWNEPFPGIGRKFLATRYAWGKDADLLRKFHVGLEPNSWGQPAILFPMKSMTGEWFYTRRSVLEGPKYEHEHGKAAPLYLPLPPQEEVVYLCEGHSDTLTARWLGLPAMGLMGTSSWKQHLDYLRKFREVRVVMDADRAGWGVAQGLYENLCNARLLFLYLPALAWHEEWPRLLSKTSRPKRSCTAERCPDRGAHQCNGTTDRCQEWLEPYCDLGLDLTDVTKRYGAWWARRLLGRWWEGVNLGARGHADGYASREGCSRCGARKPRPGHPQARLPRAEALPSAREPAGVRGSARYLGAGW